MIDPPLTHAQLRKSNVGKEIAEWEPRRVEGNAQSDKNKDGECERSYRCNRTERDGG